MQPRSSIPTAPAGRPRRVRSRKTRRPVPERPAQEQPAVLHVTAEYWPFARTGGLADTVEPWNPVARTGTGFSFDHFTPEGLRWALDSALRAWADPEAWRQIQKNGMAKDFSWDRQVLEYEAAYRRARRPA